MDYINFSRIQFTAENVNQTNSVIIIKIRNHRKGSITLTPISVDRCCKSIAEEPNIPNGSAIKDEMPRITCNMTKEDFLAQYVQKRKAVILQGCQKTWPARKWTFEGIFMLSSYFCCKQFLVLHYIPMILLHIIFDFRTIKSLPS